MGKRVVKRRKQPVHKPIKKHYVRAFNISFKTSLFTILVIILINMFSNYVTGDYSLEKMRLHGFIALVVGILLYYEWKRHKTLR